MLSVVYMCVFTISHLSKRNGHADIFIPKMLVIVSGIRILVCLKQTR